MNESIFRKKSLDKIKSPENLDDYIRVSNPGVWLLLASVIILLAGICVWGVFGHVDSTLPAAVRVKDGKAVCCVQEEDISSVQAGQTVRFSGYEAAVMQIGESDEEGYNCILSDVSADDGFYEGKITIKSYRPLSFILN